MDDDLAALRRRAYSREGTEEDRRRLAAAEAPSPSPEPSVDVGERRPVADERSPTPDSPPSAPPRRRVWPLLVAAAVGMGIGVTVGALGAPAVTTTAEPYPWNESLRVFDRPGEAPPEGAPTPTDPMLDERQAEVRYLGEVDDVQVFASRSTNRVGTAEICLHLVRESGSGTACTPEDAFRRSGVAIGTGDLGIGWGPFGPEVRRVDSSTLR